MAETFPFGPNWKDTADLSLSFKTTTFKSRSGKQQRRALRTTPRRTLSFSSFVTGDAMRSFTRTLTTKQDTEFVLADWSRSIYTLGIAAGATSFSVTELVPDWLVAGAHVLLIDGTTRVQATVASASGYTVTLSEPVAAAFSTYTKLRPAWTGRIGRLNTKQDTSATITAKVEFNVTPATQPNSTDNFFAYMTGGKEVFAIPWNWGEQVGADYDWEIEQVDFGRGVTITHKPVDFGTVDQRFTVIRQGPQIEQLVTFIERQRGKRGEFWLMSGLEDMVAMSDIANGSTSFSVAGSHLANEFGADPVHKGVALVLRDGRTIYRKINSITLSSGNSVLNLSDPFSFAVPTWLIAKICWMRVVHFASDDFTIEFLSDSVAQSQLATASLSYGSDSLDYTPYDGAAIWTMDNWGEGSEAVMDSIDYMMNGALPFGDALSLPLAAFDDLINSELWEAAG